MGSGHNDDNAHLSFTNIQNWNVTIKELHQHHSCGYYECKPKYFCQSCDHYGYCDIDDSWNVEEVDSCDCGGRYKS